MTASLTFLTPGQRYTQPGVTAWQLDHQFTISLLDRDPLGIPRVTVRRPDGSELVVYAAQIEAAVADGELLPVVGAGQIARC